MRSPSVPKYAAIVRDLKALCRSLLISNQIPSEEVITQNRGVSRITIQQARQHFADEMWVVHTRGRGTFVRRLAVTKHHALASFTEDMHARGVAAAIRPVASKEAGAPADVALDLLSAPTHQ